MTERRLRSFTHFSGRLSERARKRLRGDFRPIGGLSGEFAELAIRRGAGGAPRFGRGSTVTRKSEAFDASSIGEIGSIRGSLMGLVSRWRDKGDCLRARLFLAKSYWTYVVYDNLFGTSFHIFRGGKLIGGF